MYPVHDYIHSLIECGCCQHSFPAEDDVYLLYLCNEWYLKNGLLKRSSKSEWL
jgi:hypothetical protein